jgi:hypothetical protein
VHSINNYYIYRRQLACSNEKYSSCKCIICLLFKNPGGKAYLCLDYGQEYSYQYHFRFLVKLVIWKIINRRKREQQFPNVILSLYKFLKGFKQ